MRFVSILPKALRSELEELLYFHPEQGRFQKTIMDSVSRYGAPTIVSDAFGEGVVVTIGSLGPVQCLFALDSDFESGEHLAGVVPFHRPTPERIDVLHIVVAPDYLLGSGYSGGSLAIEMIEEVRSSARRIKGVDAVALHYGRGGEVLLRVR